MVSISPSPLKYSASPGGVNKLEFLGRPAVCCCPGRALRVSAAAFVSSSGAKVRMLDSGASGVGHVLPSFS